MTRRHADTATISLLDLIEQIDSTAHELLNDLRTEPAPPEPIHDGRDVEGELYSEINAAVIEAIRESGLSRDQVVQYVNAQFGRTSDVLGADGKRPLSLHMLNNYLAESKSDSKIPLWLLEGICSATGSIKPIEVLARRHAAYVISDRELMETRLGKLDAMQRDLAATKGEIRRALKKMRTGE